MSKLTLAFIYFIPIGTLFLFVFWVLAINSQYYWCFFRPWCLYGVTTTHTVKDKKRIELKYLVRVWHPFLFVRMFIQSPDRFMVCPLGDDPLYFNTYEEAYGCAMKFKKRSDLPGKGKRAKKWEEWI